MSLYSVRAVLILDNQGHRLLAKYYDTPDAPPQKQLSEQLAFEKKLQSKTSRVNGDVLILDNHLVVYKQAADVIFYIISPLEENEPMMFQVVLALRDAVDLLLEHQLDKATILRFYDRVALAVDETVDNGIILQTDPRIIAARTTRKASDEAPSLQNVDLSEKGLRTMFGFATGKLAQAVRNQFI